MNLCISGLSNFMQLYIFYWMKIEMSKDIMPKVTYCPKTLCPIWQFVQEDILLKDCIPSPKMTICPKRTLCPKWHSALIFESFLKYEKDWKIVVLPCRNLRNMNSISQFSRLWSEGSMYVYAMWISHTIWFWYYVLNFILCFWKTQNL